MERGQTESSPRQPGIRGWLHRINDALSRELDFSDKRVIPINCGGPVHREWDDDAEARMTQTFQDMRDHQAGTT
jgi:hypothetical protein